MQDIHLNEIQKITGVSLQNDINSKILWKKMNKNIDFDFRSMINIINRNFLVSEKIVHQNIIKNYLHKGLGIIEGNINRYENYKIRN